MAVDKSAFLSLSFAINIGVKRTLTVVLVIQPLTLIFHAAIGVAKLTVLVALPILPVACVGLLVSVRHQAFAIRQIVFEVATVGKFFTLGILPSYFALARALVIDPVALVNVVDLSCSFLSFYERHVSRHGANTLSNTIFPAAFKFIAIWKHYRADSAW